MGQQQTKYLRQIVAALTAALVIAPAVLGQAPYFAGKTLTIYAGFQPGGGVDNNARLVGRHIGRFIPGEPRVLNRNMPGGGGAVLANHMAVRARDDGLTLALPGRDWILGKVLSHPGVRFDPSEFAYIGSQGPLNIVLWVRADAGIASLDALRTADREIVIGALGGNTLTALVPEMLRREGLPLRVVEGYTDTSRIMLAVEQGEVDGIFAGASTLRNARGDLIDSGFIRPLLQSSAVDPDLPLLRDEFPPARQPLVDLIMAPAMFGVPAIVAPDTPAEVVAILRDAYTRMLADDEFKSDAAARGIELTSPYSGDDLARDLAATLAGIDAEIIQQYEALQ